MKASVSLFLALRYLKPKRAFLSIITLISIAGVTLGITALIVVMSVMTGFSDKIQESIVGFEPHIRVTSDNGPMENWREVSAVIQKQPGVVAVAPYVRGPVLAQSQGTVDTPIIYGIEPEAELKINDLKKYITDGRYDLKGDKVILGSILAQSMGIRVGDKITIIAPKNVKSIVEELEREQKDPNAKPKTIKDLNDEVTLPSDLTVTGIFESGRFEYDAHIILTPLYVAQELYELSDNDSVHGLSVRTTDENTADTLAGALNTKFDQGGDVTRGMNAVAWMNGDDKNRMAAIRFEHGCMFVILMIIVVVAAFCVMNTLITVTVQKRREIGILKALGANVRQIVWVFLAQGMVVGLLGDFIGFVLGISLVTFRNEFRSLLEHIFHIQIFSQDVYEFSQIPARIQAGEVAVICACSFVICSLAALIPAWFAARLDPVKALRYE